MKYLFLIQIIILSCAGCKNEIKIQSKLPEGSKYKFNLKL